LDEDAAAPAEVEDPPAQINGERNVGNAGAQAEQGERLWLLEQNGGLEQNEDLGQDEELGQKQELAQDENVSDKALHRLDAEPAIGAGGSADALEIARSTVGSSGLQACLKRC
jgi:hypothetical protein